MMIALAVLLVVALIATVARLRMWRYVRLDQRQLVEYTQAMAERNMLRSECYRMWLEG